MCGIVEEGSRHKKQKGRGKWRRVDLLFVVIRWAASLDLKQSWNLDHSVKLDFIPLFLTVFATLSGMFCGCNNCYKIFSSIFKDSAVFEARIMPLHDR